MSMALLESLESVLDTAAITGGNPMHRVLLVANEGAAPFRGWACLAVDFKTRRRYAIQISDASGATCRHHITDEFVNEPSAETGKFRWAFTLWFEVTIEAQRLVGYLAAWTPAPDITEFPTQFAPPETWLPALEAQPHSGSIDLPHMLPSA
jgi:hypothetical protein